MPDTVRTQPVARSTYSRGCTRAIHVPTLSSQTASQHYLPPWGMKPTVLDLRNLADLHTLALIR
jgi:hypothetical protein